MESKQDDLTDRIKSHLKWRLSMPFTLFLFSETMSTQMSIFSSNEIIVNSDWMSKDAIKRFVSWSSISLQNEKKSLTVYSLILKCFNIGTKNSEKL